MLPLRRWRWLVIAAAMLVLVVALAASASVQHHEGYFSPVISPDGNYVYFVKRVTTGLVWGAGIEFFTPPAHVRPWHDQFELCRVKMDGSNFETLYRWPGSPL